MDLTKKIDVVEHINPDQFRRRYFNLQKPVVIKGLTEDTVAGQKWSIDYFRETMGSLMVDVLDNSNKKSAASAFTSGDLRMRFADYLDIISRDEHTDLRIFLCNLFKENPQLRTDFPCPEIFRGALDSLGFMFFGGKDTTVRIHYDIDMTNVLHTHFGGKKKVVLIPKEYSPLLYRLPMNTYSLIDLDNPDYERYPALRFVKGYTAILEPGDSIFMPAGYWHHMTYLEGSFSVSYRKLSPNPLHSLEGILNLGLLLPIDKLCNRMLGNKWLDSKKKVAKKRADYLLNKQYQTDLEQPLGI